MSFEQKFRHEVEDADEIKKADILFSSDGIFLEVLTTHYQEDTSTIYVVKSKDEEKTFRTLREAKYYFLHGEEFPGEQPLTKEEAFDKIKEAAEFVEECGFDGKEMSRAISDILEVVKSVED